MHRKLTRFAACLPLRHCDSQPYSGCQSRRFLVNASLDLPQAALQRFPPLLDRFLQSWYKETEVNTMFIFGLFLAVTGVVFGLRWFSAHKFEYLHGVKPFEQLDQNF